MQEDRRVIVVGSGPAGATASKILSDAGIAVTLLDAGSERSGRGFTVRVGGMTLAKWRRARLEPRSEGVLATADTQAELYEEIAPGGLTNHWSCAVPRFSREDFSDGARAGEATTWPLGYDDLAPWYARVEPLLRISGTQADVPHLPSGQVHRAWALGPEWATAAQYAEREGHGLVPLPYACGSDTAITHSNNAWNAFERVVKPAERSGHLEVRFDARVQRLEWSPDKRRVTGVIFRDAKTGVDDRLQCAAVVLAAGSVNTARILLESSSAEFPEGLGNHHGVLGRYLHDHPLGKLVVDLGKPVSTYPPAYMTRGPLDATAPLYAAACVQWTGVTLLARSLLRGRWGRLPWIGFNVFGTMPPSRDNWVALDPSRRRLDGESALNLHIRHPVESEPVLLEARDALLRVLEQAGFAPKIRIWHTEPPGRSIHYAGTCRMHASPRYGMLDAFSRLHAVPNVIVADSAAFTTGPEKNPALTAMALSARASDRLARDLRAGAV